MKLPFGTIAYASIESACKFRGVNNNKAGPSFKYGANVFDLVPGGVSQNET